MLCPYLFSRGKPSRKLTSMDLKSTILKKFLILLFAVHVINSGHTVQSATTSTARPNVLPPPKEHLREKRQVPSGAPPGGFPSGAPPGGLPSTAGTSSGFPATTGTGSIPVASTVPMTTVTPAPFTGTIPAILASTQPIAAAQQITALTGQINPIKFPDSG